MKITLICPAIGKKNGERYIKTWKMEPLTIATLKAMIPPGIETQFYDDRIELIDFETQTDLVAITVETYTARRAYDISRKYRARGIPVVMGGYHPTLLPREAAEHADSVVTGSSEIVWSRVIEDLAGGKLRRSYSDRVAYTETLPDRTIFQGKDYMPLTLVEVARGCSHRCEFCAVSSCYGHRYYPRPVRTVARDIEESDGKYFFLIDDNIAANPGYTISLCKEISPLGVLWGSQATIQAAKNKELLRWLKKSGCSFLLVGFESLVEENLKQMRKGWMPAAKELKDLVQRMHSEGFNIYATFLFGFDHDTDRSFDKAVEFSLKHNFFFAAFNHLLPFPGTDLYERLKREKRLLSEKWWLDGAYRYGDIPFRPKNMSPDELRERCVEARRRFFTLSSSMKRVAAALKRRAPFPLLLALVFDSLNLRYEVDAKLGLPVGKGLDELPK